MCVLKQQFKARNFYLDFLVGPATEKFLTFSQVAEKKAVGHLPKESDSKHSVKVDVRHSSREASGNEPLNYRHFSKSEFIWRGRWSTFTTWLHRPTIYNFSHRTYCTHIDPYKNLLDPLCIVHFFQISYFLSLSPCCCCSGP